MGLIALIAVLGVPLRRSRAAPAPDEDGELVARLRAGEEQAFVTLVARHHAAMLRLAQFPAEEIAAGFPGLPRSSAAPTRGPRVRDVVRARGV